jgi:hypothetical protein
MSLWIFVAIVVIFLASLYACKKYNFSIIPPDLKLDAPAPFKMPNLKRVRDNNKYVWNTE